MKNICLFLSLLFFQNSSFSQSTMSDEGKDVLKLKTQILLVGLEEENPKTLKTLFKSKDDLQDYKDQIQGNNNALKFAIENYWKYSSSIEYKPLTEATKMAKENPEKYVLLSFFKYTDYERLQTGHGMNGQRAGWSGTGANMKYNPSTHYSHATNHIMIISMKMSETKLTIFLPSLYVSNADAVYGITQLQYMVRLFEQNPTESLRSVFKKVILKNGPKLKNKTLLLNKEDLDKELTEKAIKLLYPYPFKIVSSEEIDKAILNKTPGLAYVQIVTAPGGKGNIFIHYLTNAEDGEILGIEYPKFAIGLKGVNGVFTYNEKIKAKQLEKYTEIVKGE